MSRTGKIVLVVGIVAILLFVVVQVNQPKVVNTNGGVGSSAGTLGGLLNLGAAIIGKIPSSPPAATSVYTNEGTYRPDIRPTQSGNTLVDDSGKTLVFGTD